MCLICFSRQIISSVITDMALNEKKICFWNWKKDSFHVMMRHNKNYNELFKQSDTLSDLIEELKPKNELSEVKAN